MIEFDNVTKVYPDGTVAVENLNFTVEEGTTTVLVGPSGCGKTTTMKLVNRLQETTEGTIYYDGTDIQDLDRIELRRNIGYVIQEIGLFGHMTVSENIATVPELKGWDEDEIDERIDELLKLMDLSPANYKDQYPGELSGGQRQRVGVARALAADPDVMLMDEPFGALDPITRESLQDEFLEIQEDISTTILFVTHSIDEALKMGDKIAIFDVGEIVQYGTPQEVLNSPATEFVEDFIGADRTLKRLQITRVKEVMEPLNKDQTTGQTRQLEERFKTTSPLSPSDTMQVALSRLLETEEPAVPVIKDGDIVGKVTEEAVWNRYKSKPEEVL